MATVAISSVTKQIADLICMEMGYKYSVDWFGLVMFHRYGNYRYPVETLKKW